MKGVLLETFLFSKKGNVGVVKTNLGGNFCVLCNKIIELGVNFLCKFCLSVFACQIGNDLI